MSVSCVEDGVSHPNTRIQLGYGGSDITQLLSYLMTQTGAPIIYNDETIHSIKEQTCHLNLEECGVVKHNVNISDSENVTVFLGDEVVTAPLAYYHTEMLLITGDKSVGVMGRDTGDSEDPHDHLYLRDTSRKYTKTGDIQNDDTNDDDDNHDIDNVAGPDVSYDGHCLPLDQAILRSIEACSNDDIKLKMLSCILVVGGGYMMRGGASYLQSRLCQSVASVECEVVTREQDSDTVVWRGAAVMAGILLFINITGSPK